MNSYFFTFGHGQKHHPGYVQVIAPDWHKARELMVAEYSTKWCQQLESLEDVHPNDRIFIDEIIYSAATDAALWVACDICKTMRLDSKIAVMKESVEARNGDVRFNVNYCIDNMDCKVGAGVRINKLAERVLGVFRETH